MSGLLIDLAVVLAIAGFAWAGSKLGFVRSIVRLFGAGAAIAAAVLLRAPFAKIIEVLTPFNGDLATLIAVLGVGAATFTGVAALVTYTAGWVPHEDLLATDRYFAAVPGAVLGGVWAALMVSILILIPSNIWLSRAAARSVTGTFLVSSGSIPRWMNDTFPSYTQTLPKGKLGTVVHSAAGQLSIRIIGEPVRKPSDAGTLLEYINDVRSRKDLSQLQWNIEVAEVAALHSDRMLNRSFFAYTGPDGSKLGDRVKRAIGSQVEDYDVFRNQIVWSHSAENAFAGLMADPKAKRLILDERLLEVGIGVSSGGWFYNRMYTLGFLGHTSEKGKPNEDEPDDDRLDPIFGGA